MTDYKDTLNLPRTAFEMRAGLAVKEPKMLAQWAKDKLYERILAARKNGPKFLLHDGPPYANGTLHHGHILNKIIKDIVVKYRTMGGYHAPYVPGWDCHGLPIETQVDKELGAKKSGLSKAQIHVACRAYAARFVDQQREGFKRLGVFGRWQEPYLTMNRHYEASIVRQFARLFETGLVYKGLRPVHWCLVHQTALAEAEVEYDNHRSPSVYVRFAVQGAGGVALPEGTSIAIWTTTPWTLPVNQAIAVHPELDYVVYQAEFGPTLVAQGLVEAFLAATSKEPYDSKKVVSTFTGAQLENITYQHPFLERQGRVLLGDFVTLEAGTGCVHCAPAHGADDFEVCKRYGIAPLTMMDGRGIYNDDAGPFAKQNIFAANPGIIAHLAQCGALLNGTTDTIDHRYAHCWRCHKPIVTRTTQQWWVSMDKAYNNGVSLRERALAAIEEVEWTPPWGKERIGNMLRARPDWCLSRQRTWGVPIAVAYCNGCDTPYTDASGMENVARAFEKDGAAAWYDKDIETLFGGQLVCKTCGRSEFRKDTDILDVWFDSGASFAAVVEAEGLGHAEGPPADLYLEGSDQHRGWFHSSLLLSLATRMRAPYRSVLTHGFVVDGQGKKISKSKGNYIDPFVAIDKDGAEILRLWAASEDYRDDIRLSQEILTRLTDSYRKVRNTLRYLLGSLCDFTPHTDVLPFDKLLELDQYALCMVHKSIESIRQNYDTYNFHGVMQQVVELCGQDLSAFYLDILKDRLYASAASSPARRSAQTALWMITRDLLRVLAPIFCFTAEEAYAHLPKWGSDADSIHLMQHPGVAEPPEVAALQAAVDGAASEKIEKYEALREVRRAVNAALEQARRDKTIGASQEAAIVLALPKTQHSALKAWSPQALSDMFMVSEVEEVTQGAGLRCSVRRASGKKCARCWLYRHEVGSDVSHPLICKRCVEALS